jgi:hypothetical protein
MRASRVGGFNAALLKPRGILRSLRAGGAHLGQYGFRKPTKALQET